MTLSSFWGLRPQTPTGNPPLDPTGRLPPQLWELLLPLASWQELVDSPVSSANLYAYRLVLSLLSLAIIASRKDVMPHWFSVSFRQSLCGTRTLKAVVKLCMLRNSCVVHGYKWHAHAISVVQSAEMSIPRILQIRWCLLHDFVTRCAQFSRDTAYETGPALDTMFILRQPHKWVVSIIAL